MGVLVDMSWILWSRSRSSSPKKRHDTVDSKKSSCSSDADGGAVTPPSPGYEGGLALAFTQPKRSASKPPPGSVKKRSSSPRKKIQRLDSSHTELNTLDVASSVSDLMDMSL